MHTFVLYHSLWPRAESMVLHYIPEELSKEFVINYYQNPLADGQTEQKNSVSDRSLLRKKNRNVNCIDAVLENSKRSSQKKYCQTLLKKKKTYKRKIMLG